MIRAKKKITKKKLKEPDELITFTEKIFIFISHHIKPILGTGIILVIVLLSIFLYQKWEEKKEEEAYRKLNQAVYLYQMVSSSNKEGSSAEYKKVLEKLGEVISKYPKTPSGRLSLLYKGNIYLRLSEFEEASRAYETFLQKNGKQKIYRIFAMEGLGFAYEGKKEYEKALKFYQRILEESESFKQGETYLNIGRCFEKLGKNKEALENYKTFLRLSPKSIMTNVVLRKISILEH